MTSYLITFPNIFERKLFEETKAQYFYASLETLSKNTIKVHSHTFIEVLPRYFTPYSFMLNFPNCKIVRKVSINKKVHYECLNRNLIW